MRLSSLRRFLLLTLIEQSSMLITELRKEAIKFATRFGQSVQSANESVWMPNMSIAALRFGCVHNMQPLRFKIGSKTLHSQRQETAKSVRD